MEQTPNPGCACPAPSGFRCPVHLPFSRATTTGHSSQRLLEQGKRSRREHTPSLLSSGASGRFRPATAAHVISAAHWRHPDESVRGRTCSVPVAGGATSSQRAPGTIGAERRGRMGKHSTIFDRHGDSQGPDHDTRTGERQCRPPGAAGSAAGGSSPSETAEP